MVECENKTIHPTFSILSYVSARGSPIASRQAAFSGVFQQPFGYGTIANAKPGSRFNDRPPRSRAPAGSLRNGDVATGPPPTARLTSSLFPTILSGSMIVSLHQINTTVGDFSGNVRKILAG